MVNGPGEVFVERRGRIEPTGVRFAGEAELLHAIERVLAPLGRRVDEASPLCDARLADGSRVNVVIPPLSLSGPCLTIRRFRRQGFSLRDLVRAGTLAARRGGAAGRLRGGARVGARVRAAPARARPPRSTRCRARSPARERIVTIEDAAELRLRQPPRGAARGAAGRTSRAAAR